jgi:hypothetical protein
MHDSLHSDCVGQVVMGVCIEHSSPPCSAPCICTYSIDRCLIVLLIAVAAVTHWHVPCIGAHVHARVRACALSRMTPGFSQLLFSDMNVLHVCVDRPSDVRAGHVSNDYILQ